MKLCKYLYLAIIVVLCFGCANNLEKNENVVENTTNAMSESNDNIDSKDNNKLSKQIYINEINKIKEIENSRSLETSLDAAKEIYENHTYNEDLYKYHDNDGTIRDVHLTGDLPIFLKSIVCDIDNDGIKEILVFKKDWIIYKDYVDRFLQLCNNREYFITLDIYKYSGEKFDKIQSKKIESIHGDFYGGCDEILRIGYKFNENNNIIIYVEWRRDNTSLTHATGIRISKYEYIDNAIKEIEPVEVFFMQEQDYKMQNKNILDYESIKDFEKKVREMGIDFNTYNYFDKNDSYLEKDNGFNNILTINVMESFHKNELNDFGGEKTIIR